MTITISLPPETEKRLLEAAAQSGLAPDAYARRLIEASFNGGSPAVHTEPGISDEILAPVRKAFEECGLTEEELNGLFEEARDEVWPERQRNKGTQ